MLKRQQYFWWKFDECSLNAVSKRTAERVIGAGRSHDPVFDAVLRLEEHDLSGMEFEEAFDSTALNPYWEMADFYSSQWIVRKRLKDSKRYRETSKRKRMPAEPTCSALESKKDSDGRRAQCTRPARYVMVQVSAAGNISSQRRCLICFEKVLKPQNYKPLKNGRYFK